MYSFPGLKFLNEFAETDNQQGKQHLIHSLLLVKTNQKQITEKQRINREREAKILIQETKEKSEQRDFEINHEKILKLSYHNLEY